jgi:hypothetical protein
VTISDGLESTTSSVNVTVNQTLTSVTVTPATSTLAPNAAQQFTATAFDQFGNPLATPPSFTWSLDPLSAGTINQNGLYTAPDSTGNATVRATADLLYSGTASATVDDAAPTVVDPASATPNPVTGTTTLLSVLATDIGGIGHLTYTWAATASPTGADPTFSSNGNAASNATTVTFDEAGGYTFTVTISDGVRSTTSSVNVTVDQTLTTVVVQPSNVSLDSNATQQFAATAYDQFGKPMATQPNFAWSLAPLSVGSIDSNGLYTAPDEVGNAVVRATAGLLNVTGTALVTVTQPAPTPVPPTPPTPPTPPVPPSTPTITPTPTPTPSQTTTTTTAVTPTLAAVQSIQLLPPDSAGPITHDTPKLIDSSPTHYAESAASITLASPLAREPATTAIYAATFAVTSGIVAQLLIPGSFLASAFASLPAWNWVDPVSILDPSRVKQGARRNPKTGGETNKSNLMDLLQ